MHTTELYFECHITIDPVFGEERTLAEKLAIPEKFKLAKLLMDKGVASQLDTFMTGHSRDYTDLETRMVNMIKALRANGFHVRRYKIENTLLDSRPQGDPLKLFE